MHYEGWSTPLTHSGQNYLSHRQVITSSTDINLQTVTSPKMVFEVLPVLKVVFMVLFVGIVIVVGTIPLRMPDYKSNRLFRAMGTTFAGALFINVAIIHILPEAADAIQKHMKDGDQDKEVFPLAYLLVMCGFLITVFFTRIISSHSHDHQQDTHCHQHHQNGAINESLVATPTDKYKHNQEAKQESQSDHSQHGHKKNKNKRREDAYFLTAAMYFHTIFEGIAIGVQNTTAGFLSTAVAIAFHKWADALSMGIHYRNRKVATNIAYGLIIGQALLNALSIGFGWAIDSLGDFTEAIFLSISAGTFLAISTMQMLGDQLHKQEYRYQKFVILILAAAFISSVWFFQNVIFQ